MSANNSSDQAVAADGRRKTLAIVVGGGPAPGINGVIRSAAIKAINAGLRVLGVGDGYQWLAQGSTEHVTELTIDKVSRIHYQGGSVLHTARVNPTKSPAMMEQVIATLDRLGVDYLLSIGGDDTAFTASKLMEAAGDRLRVVHAPKTIDNDLPLPGQTLTFGFQTARNLGAKLVENIMEDALTAGRWYFVVSMGRTAGHLALGIGNAAGATLTVIGEEFSGPLKFDHLCDILEGAIIKRRSLGRSYGVAVLAEGLLEAIDNEDLARYTKLEYDAHDHIRYAEIPFGTLLKKMVRKRLKERGIDVTIVDKNIGYELRCQDPNLYDVLYTQILGYSAVNFLLDGGTGAMIAVRDNEPLVLPFDEIIDPQTGRIEVRRVNMDGSYYQMCREFMIRLEASDFTDPEQLARLAAAANCSVDEFRRQFAYLTE